MISSKRAELINITEQIYGFDIPNRSKQTLYNDAVSLLLCVEDIEKQKNSVPVDIINIIFSYIYDIERSEIDISFLNWRTTPLISPINMYIEKLFSIYNKLEKKGNNYYYDCGHKEEHIRIHIYQQVSSIDIDICPKCDVKIPEIRSFIASMLCNWSPNILIPVTKYIDKDVRSFDMSVKELVNGVKNTVHLLSDVIHTTSSLYYDTEIYLEIVMSII